MNFEKILICDDDIELCEFLSNYLKLHKYQTIATSKIDQLFNLIEKEKPDLIILDILMPGANGFTLCKEIRKDHKIPILILTGLTGIEKKLSGFHAGADDYITKPFQFEELLARIKANLRWGKIIKSEVGAQAGEHNLNFDGLTIDLLTSKISVNHEEVHLLPKEIKILILLAKKPLHLFSQEKIYSLIWGDMSDSGPDTVKVHIRNLRKKIEPDPSKPIFIETVRGLGYRFIGKQV